MPPTLLRRFEPSPSSKTQQAQRCLALVLLLSTGSLAFASEAGRRLVPVSPGTSEPGSITEARCPTFSWAGAPGAPGYEIAVFHLPRSNRDPRLVIRASLPADSRSWTPSVGQCLERGERYAWSVAASGSAPSLDWSSTLLFSVEHSPSLAGADAVEARVESGRDRESNDDGAAAAPTEPRLERDRGEELSAILERRAKAADLAVPSRAADPPTGPTPGSMRIAAAGSAPTLGNPSLRVAANIALAASSSLFKNDSPFLWDDSSGNLSLGRNALASASGNAGGNTAVGRSALRYTVGGAQFTIEGSLNTAVGDSAMRDNTLGGGNAALGWGALRTNSTGTGNTAVGTSALYENTVGGYNTAAGAGALGDNTTGDWNTAVGGLSLRRNTSGTFNTAQGNWALRENLTGDRNTAVGANAAQENTSGNDNTAIGVGAMRSTTTGGNNTALGSYSLSQNDTGFANTAVGVRALDASNGARNVALGFWAGRYATGSDNVLIQHLGEAGESHVLRIGDGSGAGPFQLDEAFIQGIHGRSVDGATDQPVLIDDDGKLGTNTSSARFKQDVRSLAGRGRRLLELRPVSFRYRPETGRNSDALRFGLIAEEVAQAFPELVTYDAEGRPFAVKDHLLPALLLDLVQQQQRDLAALCEMLARRNRRSQRRDPPPRCASVERREREPLPHTSAAAPSRER